MLNGHLKMVNIDIKLGLLFAKIITKEGQIGKQRSLKPQVSISYNLSKHYETLRKFVESSTVYVYWDGLNITISALTC